MFCDIPFCSLGNEWYNSELLISHKRNCKTEEIIGHGEVGD